MKFSVYYRIEHRDEYIEKFMKKMNKTLDMSESSITREKYEDLMELIVEKIILKDRNALIAMLCRPNCKNARMFFNYLTCSNIKNINIKDVSQRIDEVLL